MTDRDPAQLADLIAESDAVILRIDGNKHTLTQGEIGWVVIALRGISQPRPASNSEAK